MPFAIGLRIAWVTFGFALVALLLVVLAGVDAAFGDDENAAGAVFAFLMLAGILGIPSGLVIVRARSRTRHQAQLDQLAGYVRSRDAIEPGQLARALNTTEIAAEAQLLELISSGKVDLVFHPSRNEYLHRGRIRVAHQYFESCTSCGARIRAQVVFEGESVSCEYCDAALVPAANS